MGTRGWRVSLTTSYTERCVLHSLSQPLCSSKLFYGGLEVYLLESVLDGDKRTGTKAVEGERWRRRAASHGLEELQTVPAFACGLLFQR